jgi:hypothetical protein
MRPQRSRCLPSGVAALHSKQINPSLGSFRHSVRPLGFPLGSLSLP